MPISVSRKKLITVYLISLLSVSKSYTQSNNNYNTQLESWHQKRIESLKAENGWLNLVGLLWIAEGKNNFGSDKQNNLVFPEGSIAANAGYFERKGNTVTIVPTNAEISISGKKIIAETIVFHPDSARNPVLASGSLRWTIIKRDDKIGIRLRDLASPKVAAFKGIQTFTADTNWRIPATFQKHSLATQIPITNILGQTSLQSSPGKLFFYVNKQLYTLDALDEGDQLFIVFADQTSGDQTYGSGRFVSVDKPGADGKTVIDFNKAYNPPCAFTAYATCPLPPEQNVLPVAITAGEKDYGH